MKTQLRIRSTLRMLVMVASILATLWNSAEAAVTIIDFEEFEGSPNRTPFPPNFHGVSFSSDFGLWHPSDSRMAHSGTMAVLANRIAEGYKECVVSFTTPGRRFLGAWFVDFGPGVQFVLYKDGGVVGRSTVLSNVYTPVFLASGYDGPVDTVGILGTRGQYGFDDFTYADDPQTVCTPHAARAVAYIVGGLVTGASITDAGCGYTNAPLVLIQGGGGRGATATASVVGGQVTTIDIVNPGCCFTNTPRIVIASPPFVPTVAISVSRVRVTQSVVLGRRYVLDSSTNLMTWNVTGPAFTADSELIESEFDANATGRFFRLREVP